MHSSAAIEPMVASACPSDASHSEHIPETLPSTESGPSTETSSHCSGKQSNQYWTVQVKDVINGEVTRACLKMNDVFTLPKDKKIMLEWNELGQPIRESGGLLGQFLGVVASNHNNFAISYEKWPKVPVTRKEHVWVTVIQAKFDVSDTHKKYILQSLGKLWRDARSRLFCHNYDPALGWQGNLLNRPKNIPEDHWAEYLEYRKNNKTKEMTKKNISNRARQTISHTLGSMTMARKRDQIEMETGRPCSKAEMYAISHKRKDGSYVNDEARHKCEELQTQTQLTNEDDAYVAIFGQEHSGQVRGVGQGVCPSQMFGSSSRVRASTSDKYMLKSEHNSKMEKMRAEMDCLKAAMVMMMQHVGGSLPPGLQNFNQVEDLGSTPA